MNNYVADEASVISKVIDNEAIIIKLVDGIYYSLDQVGADIWQKILEKYSSSSILKYILANYEVTEELAQTDLANLLNEMENEKIIVISSDVVEQQIAENNKKQYTSPKLNTYKEMGDLLALDPPVPNINDVWKK